MSVDFSVKYDILIRGDREDIARIPEVDEALADAVREALQSRDNPITIGISGWSVALDEEEGYPLNSLRELDKRMPELQIAMYAEYDDEYATFRRNFLYSPKGASALGMIDDYCCWWASDGWKVDFPDEDWIPELWKTMQEEGEGEPLPPYAKANMTLAFLGDWTKDERAIVRGALNTPKLSAALFCAEWSVSDSESGAISVNMSGLMDFSEIARNLRAALADFLTPERREIYARLCEAMREKKLLICLTIHQSTCPAYDWRFDRKGEWYYLGDGVWRFFVSSDGKQLISRYEALEMLSPEIDIDCAPPLADMVYHFYMDRQRENKDNEELAEERAEEGYVSLPDKPDSLQRFFAHKAILTNLPELSEIKIDPKSLQFDSIDGVLENKFIDGYVTPELSQAVAKAIEAADAFAVTPAPPFTPASFDRRFAGKTFAVKGDDFGGYAPGEIQRIITEFGGAVVEEIANGADFVVCGASAFDDAWYFDAWYCGGGLFPDEASMGKTFVDDALRCGAALLSPEYFEDMTR